MNAHQRVPKAATRMKAASSSHPCVAFWSAETTRGFLVICPPCYKKQNTQGDQEKNIGLIKKGIYSRRAPGKESLSFKESTAFQEETLSSPRSGNRCCTWGTDGLISSRGNLPKGTSSMAPALQQPSPASCLPGNHAPASAERLCWSHASHAARRCDPLISGQTHLPPASSTRRSLELPRNTNARVTDPTLRRANQARSSHAREPSTPALLQPSVSMTRPHR